MRQTPNVAHLPDDVRSAARLFAFYIGNRTLALEVDPPFEAWETELA